MYGELQIWLVASGCLVGNNDTIKQRSVVLRERGHAYITWGYHHDHHSSSCMYLSMQQYQVCLKALTEILVIL